MPKKPDDHVGEGTGPAAGGGRQTPEQQALTAQGAGGLSDGERKADWSRSGEPGRPPVVLGGSSQGQADRMPGGGGSRPPARADNPAVTPGHRHETD